jgi:hypothetical protein
MAMALIAANYRTKHLGLEDFNEAKKGTQEQIFLPESYESITVPLEEFSEDNLKRSLYMSMLSTLKIIGLDYKIPILVEAPLVEFLDKRFCYFSDDVPHKDFFDHNN